MRDFLSNRMVLFTIILMMPMIPVAIYALVMWSARRMADRWISQFVELWPDRCPICAYHRFGVTSGLVDSRADPKPEPHLCREKP